MLSKRKAPTTLAAPAAKQSAKAPTKTRIDETRTAVSTSDSLATKPPASSNAAEPIEISSGSSDDDDYELEDDANSDAEGGKTTKTNGTAKSIPATKAAATTNGDTEMADASDEEEGDSAEPTLGDLLRGSTTVDVSASLQKATTPLPLTKQPQTALVPAPTLSSLGTVLNQALRTDDSDLLESCLSTTDLPTVRATIERIDSSLAGTLLSKLASRMHRRPGRAHSLMTWVQWTLVAHGGALAGRADLLSRLSDLNRVLEERSRGLTSLLALKGKLDMLDSQMQLRRENKARNGRRGAEEEGRGEDDEDEDEEEEGVVYVEGEEEEVVGNGRRIGGGEEEDGMANGIGGDSDEEGDSEEEEESDEDVDEVPAGGREDVDEDEIDFDDVEESGDDESEAEVEAPPAKMAKTGKKARRG
ncbi:Dip2/Utp12 family-domain-containing protein [Coniochaeta sp. 2T2.1]|nr:Dip2/Utp12 family-domain-containing protein [Coniochaeta sp. 2T2.1]